MILLEHEHRLAFKTGKITGRFHNFDEKCTVYFIQRMIDILKMEISYSDVNLDLQLLIRGFINQVHIDMSDLAYLTGLKVFLPEEDDALQFCKSKEASMFLSLGMVDMGK